MSGILAKYKEEYLPVEEINRQITELEHNISGAEAEGKGRVEARIEHLKATLEKVDDYMLTIKGFQELARKSITSINVPTIEAPPGYRVNLNRLRNWAMMIDPQAADDPFAQRVFAVAKCDELFLEQKKREFEEKIKQLEEDRQSGYAAEINEMHGTVKELKEKRDAITSGSDMQNLAKSICSAHQDYCLSDSIETYVQPEKESDYFAPGEIAVPFEIGSQAEEDIKDILGDLYSNNSKEVLIPLELSSKEDSIIIVDALPSNIEQIDRGIQNYIMQQIQGTFAGMRKIHILDAIRFNTNAAGSLRQLEGSFALEQIPRNPEQLTLQLERITASLGDIDDIIDLHDSVHEYNNSIEDVKQIPLTTLVLYGWPNAFSTKDQDLVRRVLTNFERYGISAVIIRYGGADQQDFSKRGELPEYAMFHAYYINMRDENATLVLPEDEKKLKFKWYELEHDVSESYGATLKAHSPETGTIGNDYTKRYDLSLTPNYHRGYKPIIVPFGIDGKDQEISISFDKNNFAAYLIGQSGSGKSTLIHTIIAGLIRNYHPDDVELWLADFKQVEFKQYIDHTPPHVKYILLDESNELVYDLIEKLNDEMLYRQRLLASLGKEKLYEIHPEKDLGKPLPTIFVILDEFSIMSQAIDEDQSYKLKLQNLLAKGRALGFKFIFASQNFTTGVTGLSLTARDQIQQRIAMKQTKEEINDVLALSPALRTEKVQNWIDTIPPFYALIKRRINEDTLAVNRVKVMYFSDDYQSRDDLIDRINSDMRPVESYDFDDPKTYVNKDPVFVDGNKFDSYDPVIFDKLLSQTDHSADETVISLGTPRLMSRVKAAVLSPESREHILLIARNSEQECAASIIQSIKKEFIRQGRKVSIWAYGRNRLWKEYSNILSDENVHIVEGTEAICGEIRKLKVKFDKKENEKQLIILLGMDRVCIDFEYAEADRGHKGLNRRTIEPIELKPDQNPFSMIGKGSRPKDDTIDDMGENSSIYNALGDFKDIIRSGSRYGTHFLMALTSLSDLKSTSIREDEFRHKVMFQMSVDDSRLLIGNRSASLMPERICLYNDTFEQYSLRPYLHQGISWDGWDITDLEAGD